MDDFFAKLAAAMNKAKPSQMPDNRVYFDKDGNRVTEEELHQQEQEEAEDMIRKGAGSRDMARRQFTVLGQGEVYKLYRKYGMNPDGDDHIW